MASIDGALPETGLHKGTNWWGAFDADLIVLGGPRRGELATRLFGGVTLRVLRRSSCPVIVAARKPARPRPAVPSGGPTRGQGQI